MQRLAVEGGTRGDSRAGGNEQNAGAGRKFFGRNTQCRHQRGGMHALVVGDGDPFDRHCELGGQGGTITRPGRRGDNHVDVGKPSEASRRQLWATWAPAAANCSSIAADRLNRSTLRASSSPTVRGRFHRRRGSFIHPVHTAKSEIILAPVAQQRRSDGGERKVLAHPMPGSASLVTTKAQWMVCDRKKPSTICSAVRIPHAPFAMSNENVP